MNVFKRFHAIIRVASLAIAPQLSSHPADINGDNTITLAEITDYTAVWTQEGSWPKAPSTIPEVYHEQALLIWRNGEAYREVAGVPEPYNWVPDSVGDTTWVATESRSSEPFDSVTLSGIDPGLPLDVTFSITGEPGNDFTTLWWAGNEPDTIGVRIPLNPFTMDGRGQVELLIRDTAGDARWKAPSIELEPLPPAPGATAAVLQKVRSAIVNSAARQGHNLEIHQDAHIADVPRSLRPLVYLKASLDHPENPSAFDRLLNDGLPAEDLDKLDRILAKLNLSAEMRLAMNSLSQSVSEPPRSQSIIGTRAGGCSGDAFLLLNNTLELSNAMTAQRQAEIEINFSGRDRDVAKDILTAKDNLGLGKQALDTLIGIKPDAPGPDLLQAISLTLMYADFFDHYDKGTLPSIFVDLDLSIDGPGRGYFLEDQESCGPAVLIGLVTARSTGYDHTEMLANVVPGGPLGLPGPKNAFEWLHERYPDFDLLDTDPLVWCDFNVSGLYSNTTADEFLTVKDYNDTKAGMDFIAAKVGTGTLTMKVDSPKFGGRSIQNSASYSTSPITVSFVNPVLQITGDEASVTYRARLTDADQTGDDDIEWSASKGEIKNRQNLGNGLYQMDWIPSQENADYPVTIKATSATEKCLRENRIPVREHAIMVEKYEWRIEPDIACMEPGMEELFRVEDGTLDIPDAVWSITSGNGQIESDTGLFTAGPTGGEVTVRATLTDPDGKDAWKEETFYVGCGMTAVWDFPPFSFPAAPSTERAIFGGFIVENEGGILSDLFVTYDSVTPPADGELVGTVEGSYQGVGIFYTEDEAESESLVDDSQATQTHTILIDGQPVEYVLNAAFSDKDLNGEQRPIQLLGGGDGGQMELRFETRTTVPSFDGRLEIAARDWTFTPGGTATGEDVTVTVPRTTEKLTVELKVNDSNGGTATYIASYILVEVAGDFSFRYEPAGTFTACIFSDFDLPPMNTGGGIVEFTTNPDVCGSSLFTNGGRIISASRATSGAGIVSDDGGDYFVISFQPQGIGP